ncbi:MAG: O-antigen ligase family protein, partial [Geminicoccaceae bacterium]|nr:O-antigen ligase family protein [Geminicoccaceae bacterium]
LLVAWLALSPNKDYIAVFLMGSVLASIAVGLSVLLDNTDKPYLAKYYAPYVGLLILTAWAAGRPFNGAWRWITSAAVLLATILAIHASARWALISIGVVGIAALVPRPYGLALRALVLVTCAVPLLPLLALDPGTAATVMTARNLASASDVERLLLYAFAHESMINYPIYGIGFERFLNEFEGRFGHLLTMASSVQGPHNQYAAIGALFGVPALLIYATAVASSVFLLLRLTKTAPSRLKLACLLLWGFMFLANEISDDARLALYLVAALMACGAPAQRSWLGALLPRRRDAASLPPAQLA